jgi:hypothetical protein
VMAPDWARPYLFAFLSPDGGCEPPRQAAQRARLPGTLNAADTHTTVLFASGENSGQHKASWQAQ